MLFCIFSFLLFSYEGPESFFFFCYEGSARYSSFFSLDGGFQLHNRQDCNERKRSATYLIIHEGSFAFGGRGCGGCKTCSQRTKFRLMEFDSTLGTCPTMFIITHHSIYIRLYLYRISRGGTNYDLYIHTLAK